MCSPSKRRNTVVYSLTAGLHIFARFCFISGLLPDLTNIFPYLSAISTSILSILNTHSQCKYIWNTYDNEEHNQKNLCIHHCLCFTPITMRNNNMTLYKMYFNLIYKKCFSAISLRQYIECYFISQCMHWDSNGQLAVAFILPIYYQTRLMLLYVRLTSHSDTCITKLAH